jgi:hypothetical protein
MDRVLKNEFSNIPELIWFFKSNLVSAKPYQDLKMAVFSRQRRPPIGSPTYEMLS